MKFQKTLLAYILAVYDFRNSHSSDASLSTTATLCSKFIGQPFLHKRNSLRSTLSAFVAISPSQFTNPRLAQEICFSSVSPLLNKRDRGLQMSGAPSWIPWTGRSCQNTALVAIDPLPPPLTCTPQQRPDN